MEKNQLIKKSQTNKYQAAHEYEPLKLWAPLQLLSWNNIHRLYLKWLLPRCCQEQPSWVKSLLALVPLKTSSLTRLSRNQRFSRITLKNRVNPSWIGMGITNNTINSKYKTISSLQTIHGKRINRHYLFFFATAQEIGFLVAIFLPLLEY